MKKRGGGAPRGNQNAKGNGVKGGRLIGAVGGALGPVGAFAAGAVTGAKNPNAGGRTRRHAAGAGAVLGSISGAIGGGIGGSAYGPAGTLIGASVGAVAGSVVHGGLNYGAARLGTRVTRGKRVKK
jgi:hypothetical protein